MKTVPCGGLSAKFRRNDFSIINFDFVRALVLHLGVNPAGGKLVSGVVRIGSERVGHARGHVPASVVSKFKLIMVANIMTNCMLKMN